MHEPRLEDFLDGAAIEALGRPAGTAIGLPGSAYGADFYELERQKLFPRTWAAVAVGAQLPHPGDAVPVDLAGWPLIVLRDRAGEIRCFHNICRHRGMRLVTAPGRLGNVIRCPWHAWTYRRDGSLVATPDVGGESIDEAAGLCLEALGLKAVRTDRWLDYVLVNIDGKAPPIEAHTAPVNDLLAGRELSVLRHGADWTHSYRGNWKIAIEGGIEDLHVPWGHPQALRDVVSRNPRIDTAEGCFAATSFRYQYAPGAKPGAGNRGHLMPPIPTTNRDGGDRSFIVNLFPTAVMGVFPDHMLMGLELPDGPDRTRLEFHYYFNGAVATDPAYAAAREETVEAWAGVATQDDDFVRYVDANKDVRDTAGIEMRFSPFWETAVQHFQKMVVEAVRD